LIFGIWVNPVKLKTEGRIKAKQTTIYLYQLLLLHKDAALLVEQDLTTRII